MRGDATWELHNVVKCVQWCETNKSDRQRWRFCCKQHATDNWTQGHSNKFQQTWLTVFSISHFFLKYSFYLAWTLCLGWGLIWNCCFASGKTFRLSTRFEWKWSTKKMLCFKTTKIILLRYEDYTASVIIKSHRSIYIKLTYECVHSHSSVTGAGRSVLLQ